MIPPQNFTILEMVVGVKMRLLYRYALSITGVLQDCIIWVVVALSEYMALVKKTY